MKPSLFSNPGHHRCSERNYNWGMIFFAVVGWGILLIGCVVTATAEDPAGAVDSGDEGTAAVFTQDQKDKYHRDGYLVVSNLLSDDDVNRLVLAGEAVVGLARDNGYKTFNVIEKGVVYDVPSAPDDDAGGSSEIMGCNNGDDDDDEEETAALCADREQVREVFRDIALRSVFPGACAELMDLDPSRQNLRMLRDVFLAKPVDSTEVCDWHVDDQGFWPESFVSSASVETGKDQHGINVWIALDDMPAKFGGSMILSPGSDNADWRHDAYLAIGQNRTRPGPTTKEEVLGQFFSKRSTCKMDQSDPELREKIEATKVLLDVKKGDVIFANRLLFHRTISVSEEGKKYYAEIDKASLNRYSIRYVPGSARLPLVYNPEWSLILNEDNCGRTLDGVMEKDGTAWYPQVWPAVENDLDDKLNDLANTKLDLAKKKFKEYFAEAQSIIQELKKTTETSASSY